MTKVFLAGGSGLVGSALMRNVPKSVQVYSPTRSELELRDRASVTIAMRRQNPDVVILAAAKVGGIMANSKYQREFLVENIEIQNSVILSARNLGIPKLIFLGSSCIYPKEAKQPIVESALLTGPLEPTNEGYALAKITGVRLCRAISEEDGFNYFSLMPTNLYGPNDNFHPEHSHVPASLIRRFHEAKNNNTRKVEIWGSGKPRREFMHVDDLAEACWFLLDKVKGGEIINVGTGEETTISDLAKVISAAVGYEGEMQFDISKPDGPPRKLLDVRRIHSLGWKHKIKLDVGIRSTYEWFVRALMRGEVRER